MSGDRTYASVPERITWTFGFRVATDKIVLGALSTFASLKTGKGARVRVSTLAARAGVEPRTVQRALHRLEADGWIVAVWRGNKKATAWDIQIDRLASSWGDLKAVGGVMPSFPQVTNSRTSPLSFESNVTDVVRSNVTDVVREAMSNVTAVVRAPFSNVTDVVRENSGVLDRAALKAFSPNNIRDVSVQFSNVTDVVHNLLTPVQKDLRSPVEPIPSAPALRAGLFEHPDDEKPEDPDAPQSAVATADVRADGRDHPNLADSGDGLRQPPGSDQAPAPGAGVSLRERSDLPGPESDPRPRAPMEPQQAGLGLLADVKAPIDGSPSPTRPAPQWGQLAEALREGLKRKSG